MPVVNETVAANMPNAVVTTPMRTPMTATMSSSGDGRGSEEEQQQ